MNLKETIYIRVKDHSVSGDVFDLNYNPELDMLSTFPKPEGEFLARYYESDDYISHTDGKRSLFEKVYHFIKRLALKNKLNLLRQLHPQKGSLLDIGAGTGDFLNVAGTDGWKITGIEPNGKAKAIAIAKGGSFVESSEILADGSFDIITLWHVLEHVPDLNKQISELKRLLRPEGSIIVAVPNFKSHDALIYKEFWAAYDVPRHLWHFSKTSIEKIFAKYDLKLMKVMPMPFDAYYVSLLSEKYKNGWMNPVLAIFNGLKSNYKARKSREFSSHIYIIKHGKVGLEE